MTHQVVFQLDHLNISRDLTKSHEISLEFCETLKKSYSQFKFNDKRPRGPKRRPKVTSATQIPETLPKHKESQHQSKGVKKPLHKVNTDKSYMGREPTRHTNWISTEELDARINNNDVLSRSLPQGMIAPLMGISWRVTTPPYPFSTYTSKNTTTSAVDPLEPHNMLQDPMVSALSATKIAYIAGTVSQQVRQQERENDKIPTVVEPYPSWAKTVTLCLNFKLSQFRMLNGSGNLTQISKCGPIINGPPTIRDALLLHLSVQSL